MYDPVVVELQLKLPLDENPELVCAWLTVAEAGVQFSVPGPVSLTTVTEPVAVLPLIPADDEADQVTLVEPAVVIELGAPDADVAVFALVTVNTLQAESTLIQGTGSQTGFLLNWSAPDPVLRGLLRDLRFRKALSLAIDREKCNEVVFRMDRDVFTAPQHRYYPELANVRFYADAVDAYNAERRACPKCGAAQARFPQEICGWRRYVQYVELANRARTNIEAAARG